MEGPHDHARRVRLQSQRVMPDFKQITTPDIPSYSAASRPAGAAWNPAFRRPDAQQASWKQITDSAPWLKFTLSGISPS
jgi:hypothetical protein